MCSLKCSQGPNHELECKIYSGKDLSQKFDYGQILALRALELKNVNLEKWNRFTLLMDRDEENVIETELLSQYKTTIEFLVDLGYEMSDILHVLGIIRMNSLRLQDPDSKLNQISGKLLIQISRKNTRIN